MSKIIAVCFILIALIAPTAADVCLWNEQALAERALKFIQRGDALQEFCGPCGDKRAKRTTVDKTEIIRRIPDNPQSSIVKVNDVEADLAYIYVRDPKTKDRWINLGKHLRCGLEAQPDIPNQLKPEQVLR